jgi:hypothetical protein
VLADLTPQSGREMAQIPVVTIHVHPEREGEQGLSDATTFKLFGRDCDYRTRCSPSTRLFARSLE